MKTLAGGGCAWADYDNDGDPDLFVGANRSDYPNLLFENQGDGSFQHLQGEGLPYDIGVALGASWGDYDNDGYLDLFVANQYAEDFLYPNDRDGTFTRVLEGEIATLVKHCCEMAWADFNNDGFLDVYVGCFDEKSNWAPEPNLMYRNQGNDNSWIIVRLEGTASNRSAIGAKLRLKATIWGNEIWQLRQVAAGESLYTQGDLRAHFGLGDATQIDLFRIEWPSGIVREMTDLPVNQILTITEPPRLIPQQAGRFEIQCWINQSFEVQASTDLATWSDVTTVTNLTGTLVFEDAEAGQYESQYYRVVTR